MKAVKLTVSPGDGTSYELLVILGGRHGGGDLVVWEGQGLVWRWYRSELRLVAPNALSDGATRDFYEVNRNNTRAVLAILDYARERIEHSASGHLVIDATKPGGEVFSELRKAVAAVWA